MNPGQKVAVGNTAEIYEKNGMIIKLYFAGLSQGLAEREARKQRLAVASGLPAPRVIGVECIQGRQALLMEAVRGRPLAELILAQPHRSRELMQDVVVLQQRICSVAGDGADPLKPVLQAGIERAEGLAESERSDLLERLGRLPEQNRLCHGDFHPLNILLTQRGAVVIDWCNLASCDPGADLCRSYLTYLLHAGELAELYLTLACGQFRLGREAVLEWMPVMAATFLNEAGHTAHRERLLQLLRG